MGRCALALAMAVVANVCLAASNEVTVTSVVGKVEHRVSGQTAWARSKVGTRLKPGGQLRTARSSKAEMRFPDGTTFRLGPQSQVTIAQTSKPSAKVAKGSVFGKIVKGSLVRVQGRYGTATVRGTDILFDSGRYGDTLRVWGGTADYSAGGGTQHLTDGTGSFLGADGVPTLPGLVAPEQFAGVSFLPYFEQFQSDMEMTALDGTPARQTDFGVLAPVVEDTTQLEPNRTGLVEVVLEHATDPWAPAGGGDLASAVGGLLLGAAETEPSLQRAIEPTLSRGIYGPVGNVGVYGGMGDGASFAGARAGVSAVAGPVYAQASGRYSAVTHRAPQWTLDETFAAIRGDGSDLTAGRFRLLESPVNNSDRAALVPFSVCDGLRYGGWIGSRWRLSAAWLGSFDPLLEDNEEGWFGRVQYFDEGRWFGLAGLAQTGAQTGLVGQFGLPLGQDLELYGEMGTDTRGRSLFNLGLAFPELLYDHNLSLRLERGGREGLEPLNSLHAYWGVGEGRWLLGSLDVADDGDWGFAAGVFLSFDGIR